MYMISALNLFFLKLTFNYHNEINKYMSIYNVETIYESIYKLNSLGIQLLAFSNLTSNMVGQPNGHKLNDNSNNTLHS